MWKVCQRLSPECAAHGDDNPKTKSIGERREIKPSPRSGASVCRSESCPNPKNLENHPLNVFLGDLTPETRVIFLRRYWYVETVAEIAERYCIPERKVRKLLNCTRAKLQCHFCQCPGNTLQGLLSGLSGVDRKYIEEAEGEMVLGNPLPRYLHRLRKSLHAHFRRHAQ